MIRWYKYCQVLLFGVIVLMACTAHNDDLSDATFIGVDARLCACCGGFLIKVSDKPGETFQWQQRGETFGINASDAFPFKSKIKYHFLANTCVASDGEIEITELIKIK